MSNGLPPIGVEAVVKNWPNFQKILGSMDSVVSKAAKGIEQATTKTTEMDKASTKAQKSISLFTDGVSKLGQMAGGAGSGVDALISQVLSLSGVSATTAAAVATIGAAIFALGLRGGTVKGVAEAFDNLAASAETTGQVLLGNLRTASRGTITDFSLMQQANVALSGSTGELAKRLGQDLPKLLEISRVQARATGRDIQFLFDSLVGGIKRGSPLLIDNTGLVLKEGAANETYAKSIGKTVEQLTAQEKQIALLNATLQAGGVAMATIGAQQELSTEKWARMQATIGNIVDTLGVAFEPIVGRVLDVVNTVLGFVGNLVSGLATIFGPIIQVVSDFVGIFTNAFGGIVNIVNNVISTIAGVIGNVVETIVAPFQVAIEIVNGLFGGLIGFIGSVIQGIVNGLATAANFIIGLARLFFVGGARVIGALAGGIAAAANKFVLPAVKAVAKLIADFLVGLSPPPKGPLSAIDKGGENVMKAWLDGFVGAGLDPIEKVSADVVAMMGEIGRASRDQVEKRLAILDKAIQPFADKLAIIKAQFDALKEPVDAAFRSIDRQMEQAVQALARGEAGSAEMVRQLDSQRAALEGMVDARQAEIDQATIQLSLVKAAQAQERVLLGIRQRQLGPIEKAVKATEQVIDKAAKAPEKKGGGGGGGAGGGAPEMALTDPGKAGGGFADTLKESLGEGFMQGIGGEAGLADLQQNVSGVQAELARIGSVDIGSKIKEKLGSVFDPNKEGSIIYNIRMWFKDAFDPASPNSIIKWFESLGTNIAIALADLGTTISANIIDPAKLAIGNFVTWVINIDDPTSLPGSLKFAISQIPTAVANTVELLNTSIVQPVKDKLTEIGTFVHDLFAGTGEGSISWFLSKAVEFFAALPAQIGGALSSMGQWFVNTFVNPIIDGINSVLAAFEGFINANIIPGIKQLGAHILTIMTLAGQAGSESYNSLFSAIQGAEVKFGRVAKIGAAKGGLFSGGVLRVGEQGEEIVASASKMAVFPNQFVRAVNSLSHVMAQPAPIIVPGGSNSTTNTYNNGGINATFNNVPNNQDAMRRLGIMRATTR